MRPSILSIVLALVGLGLAGCDARPASGGGGGPVPVSGAHTAHLTGTLARPIDCAQCHDSQFDVTLQGSLAAANGAKGSFHTASSTCSNVYCHDGGPQLEIGGGTVPLPVWNPPSVIICGGCHAAPGSGTATPWHPAVAPAVQCALCHPGYTNTSVDRDVHVNGLVNLTVADLATNCAACHGDATRVLPPGTPSVVLAAPPVDRTGSSDTRRVGVGAHQAHLLPGAPAISSPIACSECHLVPTDLSHVGPDAATPATLDWGALATANGVAASFDSTAATCANYCHGATLTAGTLTQPVWTQVDGTQARCGTCHGDPPSSGAHIQHASPLWYGISCGVCHPTGYAIGVVGAAVVPLHVNGQVNMNPAGFASWNAAAAGPSGWTGTATGCHGGTRYWSPGVGGSCQ
jgi:predicted CxxxxCH...CXXCH cytochrome family protein